MMSTSSIGESGLISYVNLLACDNHLILSEYAKQFFKNPSRENLSNWSIPDLKAYILVHNPDYQLAIFTTEQDSEPPTFNINGQETLEKITNIFLSASEKIKTLYAKKMFQRIINIDLYTIKDTLLLEACSNAEQNLLGIPQPIQRAIMKQFHRIFPDENIY